MKWKLLLDQKSYLVSLEGATDAHDRDGLEKIGQVSQIPDENVVLEKIASWETLLLELLSFALAFKFQLKNDWCSYGHTDL